MTAKFQGQPRRRIQVKASDRFRSILINETTATATTVHLSQRNESQIYLHSTILKMANPPKIIY